MSTFNSFTSWLSKTKANVADGVKKFKNKDLLEAICAACAIVANADGNISDSEKQKMAGYLGRSQDLKVFNMSEVIDRFNHYVANYDFDIVIGKQEALRAISKIKSKPEVGRVLIGVCCAIGTADGDFDENEKIAVREICNVLSLPAGEFGL